MKWSFTNRSLGAKIAGCVIREVSSDATIVAIIPRDPQNAAGQSRAREIAQEIVLAHNDAEDSRNRQMARYHGDVDGDGSLA